MHEFYASARGPDTPSFLGGPYAGGLGSARCRKICSLKRHVPFDALYITHKVKAVTVAFRPRARSRKRPTSKKTLSVRFLDRTLTTSRRTPAITLSIIGARAHRLYSSPASISTFATPGRSRASAQTTSDGMRLLSTRLRHFVSVVSRLLRFTVDAPNSVQDVAGHDM